MNSESKTNKMLKKLKESNFKRAIKIRTKALKDGAHSVYLDIWHGSKREYRFLKLYITGDPIRDDEAVRLAISIRDKEEKQLYTEDTSYSLAAWKKRSDFVEYFSALAATKGETWVMAQKRFAQFANGKLLFTQLSHRLLEDYKSWLLTESGLKRNSCWLYFTKLSAALNQAVKDGIIDSNPARFISITKQDTERAFLDLTELGKLEKTECQHSEVKRAFLFSCYCGLRLSDVINLRWKDISEDHITLIQKKTKSMATNKMLPNAKELLGTRANDEDKVFKLPASTWIGKILKQWVTDAGITKDITFHSARHSFAMLGLVEGNVDIYTLKGLMGHSSISATQTYAKMIDKVKDAGIDKLSQALEAKHNNKPNEGE